MEVANEEGFNKIKVGEIDYVATKDILLEQEQNQGIIILYYDSPAINSNLSGAISEINNVKINSIEKLQEELEKYSPGEEIEIKTISEEEISVKNVVLLEHPENEDVAWLGIGFYENSRKGFLGKVLDLFPSYKKANVYYEPANDLSVFVKDFLWWIFVISL